MTNEPDLSQQAVTSAKVIELKPVTADAAPQVAGVAVRAYNDHYTHLWFDGGSWYVGRCFTPEVLREDMSHPNHRGIL